MAYTPYNPRTWQDEPSEETPYEASAMNNIENGIVELENNSIFYEEIGEIDETTGKITLYENTSTVS